MKQWDNILRLTKINPWAFRTFLGLHNICHFRNNHSLGPGDAVRIVFLQTIPTSFYILSQYLLYQRGESRGKVRLVGRAIPVIFMCFCSGRCLLVNLKVYTCQNLYLTEQHLMVSSGMTTKTPLWLHRTISYRSLLIWSLPVSVYNHIIGPIQSRQC